MESVNKGYSFSNANQFEVLINSLIRISASCAFTTKGRQYAINIKD